MVLNVAEDSGLKLSKVAREVGVSYSNVSSWKSGYTSPRPENCDNLLETLAIRARFLSSVQLTNKNTLPILKEMGINLASIVREGPEILTCRTKQDLHQKITKGIENYPDVKDGLEEYLHGIGRNLLKGLRLSSQGNSH